MEVGFIAPTSMLEECCITDIQYCLPQLLIEQEDYRKFYTDNTKDGSLTILDTRKLGWKREPEDISIIKTILNLWKPKFKGITILPSFMYDWKKTIKVTREFISEIKVGRVAGCLEGTSVEEVQKCIEGLKSIGIKVFAIPSHIYRFYKGEDLKGLTIFIENHLNIEELEDKEGILVTSLPIRLGLEGRLLSDYLPSPEGLTFGEEPKFEDIIKRNINRTLEFYRRR